MGKVIATVAAVLIVLFGGVWLFFNFAGGGTTSDTASSTSLDSLGLVSSTTSATNSATTTNPSNSSGQANQQPTMNATEATLHTSMGDITIAFYADQAPSTVANFIKLASSGFYDSDKFHRVIKGFMDQIGDPLTKDDSKMAQWGTGGPGYTIQDEFGTTYTNVAGTVAMANTGQPNSGGSQFFINAVDNHFLDGKYAVFGHVTSGMSVVTAINNTPVDSSDRPLTPVVLTSITLK
jgi:cyclophilin family peptidyl-prolyl cis-trans isomerase